MFGRRVFLHAAGAALTVPVVGNVLDPTDDGPGNPACGGCLDDPVSAEALRQFKAAIAGLARSAQGEHARQASVALRVTAVNARARNADAEVRRAIAREVKTFGRDNVLLRPFDREQYAAIAREFGVAPPPELLRASSLADRREALEALQRRGVAAYFERAARLFESAGTRLDALGPVQRAQTREEQIAMCRELQTFIFTAEAAMIVACLLGGPINCAYFSGVYLGARLYYETQTDCSRWL